MTEDNPDDEPALIEVKDDGNIGGDPDVGTGSEPPTGGGASGTDGLYEAGDLTYTLCVLLKSGPTAARLAFCASQPQSDVRARCRSHVYDSPVSWANWCYNEFAE